MCGIAGILTFDGDRGRDSNREIAELTNALAHRGPDGVGFYHGSGMDLGHRRLAIIDLDTGAQPMSDPSESVWITFNGEIYNYREVREELKSQGFTFRTDSDTEVFLHGYQAWGERCLGRLRGMFAVAIWDARQDRLFLARDRVGIKPLYYLRTPSRFAFASEVHAFHALEDFEATLDPAAIDLYLHFQYIPAPLSAYRGVAKLPPGHWLTIDRAGRMEGPKPYWNLEFVPDEKTTDDEWVERLHMTLQDTVRAHLVSDVPVGAFLSGGVDSSTIVAYMAAEVGEPIRTFSIGFDVPEYDETAYARQVARRFATQHHEEQVRPDALEVLPELVRHYGEPFADSSAVPTFYVSRLASRHVKVVLSGDGGDENFAGYTSYPNLLTAHRPPLGFWRRMRHRLGNVARTARLKSPLPTPLDTWFQWTLYFDEERRRELWRPEHRHLVSGSRAWFDGQFEGAPTDDLCSRFQYFDIRSYLANDILTKVDIASMYHGVEVRVPLLDHRLMELVATIPPRLKLRRDGTDPTTGRPVGKYILKRNAERFFPPEFLHRPKRGFEAPIRDWFVGDFQSELRARFLGPNSLLGEFFDEAVIARLIEEHAVGRLHAGRLWALLVLDQWLREGRERTQRLVCASAP